MRGGGPADAPSQVVAGFELLGELGRGGRTVTYRVRRLSPRSGAGDPLTSANPATQYAMKVVRPGGHVPAERAFRREAALLASVDDPGVVRVHEVGVDAGLPYLVMDFVDGHPLTRLLAGGPLPIDQMIRIGLDVTNALGAAHRARLVHRDIKPDNILVDAEGHARVIDFGLAVRPGEFDETSTAGTLRYCAPEQAGTLHRPVDGRADLYAVGAVLYECATGHPPFVSGDVGELLRLHAAAPVPDPRTERPELPAALAAIIIRLLAKDPDDRYQAASGLAADLRRLAQGGGADFPLGRADQAAVRADRPLIGRDPELGALLRRWEVARDGSGGGAALVEGAPGSGKSRLARELAEAVRRAGGLVLVGECQPDEGAPMAPLRRAIDEHLATVAALPSAECDAALQRVREAAGSAAALLRGLSPALDAVLAAPGLGDGDRQQQFSSAVASFLAALTASPGGALLHLDDVQWIDAGTRRVLAHLSERLIEVPLLILVSGRRDPECAPAMALVRTALGASLDLTVRLGPLPASAVGALISSVTGGLTVDDATAASLAARSDGNTFTLLQYLDAILDAGLLRPDWGRWQLDPADLHAVELPGGGVDLILRRLDGLDAESRRVLGTGAVVGPVFDPTIVAAACGLPRHRVYEVAVAAAWRNLVERRGGGYAFLHERIREALLAQFDADDLRATHQRIAEALERAGGDAPELVFALARHCQLGEADRDPGRTFRACHTAGRLALAEHAPAEALRHLRLAEAAAGPAGIPLDAAFLGLLATAQLRSGRFGEAIRTARLAHGRAEDPIQRARMLGLVAQALDMAWELGQEATTIEQALAEIGRSPASGRVALLASTLGMFALGELSRLTRIGHGTAKGEARVLFQLEAALSAAAARAHTRQMRPLPALLYTLRQMYPVTRCGHVPTEARMRLGLAVAAMGAGMRRLARRNLRRAHACADAVADPTLTAYVAWVEAFLRHRHGLDQGESVRHAVDVHSQWLDLGLRSDLYFILIWDALQRGSIREARALANRREGLRLPGEDSGPFTARYETGTAVRGVNVALLAWEDRPAEARAQLNAVLSAVVTLPAWEWQPLRGAAIVLAYEQGHLGEEFDRAVEAFDDLRLPLRSIFPLVAGFYLVRAMGRIEQCRMATGASRDARLRQAREAVALLRRIARTPLLRVHGEVVRAALRQVEGEPARALADLAACEPRLREVDAPAVAFEVARARAYALRDLGVRGESERQARLALLIARDEDWAHRVRRITAEFDLDEPAAVPDPAGSGHRTATTNETIALGRIRQRLDAIEQLGLAASRVLDPARLAAVALDETIRILGAERAFLFLTDGPSQQLMPHGGRDAEGHDVAELTAFSASTVERVRRTGQPVVITGTDEGAALGAHSVVLHGLRSVMVAPIQLDGRLLGVVYLDSRVAKGIFTQDDVGVLIAITNHVAVALETARAAQLEVAVAAANRQRDLAETLREALADISATLEPEPESVLLRLKRAVAGIVGGDRAWLVLGAPEDGKVRIHSDQTDQPSLVDPGPRLAGLLLADSTVVGGEGATSPELLSLGECCWLAVPLRTRGERLGVLLLASSRPNAYDDGRADLATALVGQAMVAYENARLFAQVQHLARVDDLTGVANRRHFFDLAARELERVRREGGGLVAMMVDIDHFKSINDAYGHQIGDEVIQIVAARLARCARDGDLLSRYGGEEFALLLPALPHPRAAAERLRIAVGEHPLRTRAGTMAVTVSVGAASLRPADADIGALLGRADTRLYEAKRGGRNRVATD